MVVHVCYISHTGTSMQLRYVLYSSLGFLHWYPRLSISNVHSNNVWSGVLWDGSVTDKQPAWLNSARGLITSKDGNFELLRNQQPPDL